MLHFLKKVMAFTVILLMLSVGAFAGTGYYHDDYTSEDSDGHWTFTSFETARQLENTSFVAATPATLTSSDSGTVYIVDGADPGTNGAGYGATGATIVTFTLPPATASTQLVYKFISGDGSGIVVRTSDINFTGVYTDTLMWGVNGFDGTNGYIQETAPTTNTQIRLTKRAKGSTGATITVRNNYNGYWYVETTANATPTTLLYETRESDPKYPTGGTT